MSTSTPRPSIELEIGELVLHGFGPLDRRQLQEAVQQELARLLDAHGVSPALAAGGEVARLDAGAFRVAPGASTGALGAQVAQALHGGLRR